MLVFGIRALRSVQRARAGIAANTATSSRRRKSENRRAIGKKPACEQQQLRKEGKKEGTKITYENVRAESGIRLRARVREKIVWKGVPCDGEIR